MNQQQSFDNLKKDMESVKPSKMSATRDSSKFEKQLTAGLHKKFNIKASAKSKALKNK